MEIPKKYDPIQVEDKWYKYWMENNYFKSTPDERESYTIVIPPPNVTGVLHMGHMLNNTIQDVLVRRARMLGKNACWVPGTDHASIATEAKVVNKLKQEGISKDDLSREEFLKHAWEWKEKHGGIILDQLKKLGASCDWDRTSFTMDEKLSASVLEVFFDLYKKGLIYRGFRMVNWDPQAKTTVSDEEVIHKEVNSKLYYVNYQIENSNEFVTIATTRPETILGDTAICINPNDERFKHLKGKKVIVPISGRLIPIIEDDYVDPEFGTGCLKITPAHDQNDKVIGERHGLAVIDVLNDDATLNHHGLHYQGKDRFVVRKEISKELDSLGVLLKVEDYQTKVGCSERTDAVIEPKISVQWFVKMDKLSAPALDAVMNDEVQLVPAKFKNTYRHWMENVHDWCISRQLWWGHQIPAYFYGDGLNDFVVAKTIEEALLLAKEVTGNNDLKVADLKQDEDVLDTWFSSSLWPISVFNGIIEPDNEEINYYYPTNDLVTAPEILFFWVARMILTGYEYRGVRPFENVYLTGIVRDKQGRKMSKSLGNSPDPIELMKKYGADGVRVGMLLCSPAGNDLPFDESLCEQGRNFSNKIWNAFRLVKGWESASIDQPKSSQIAINWFDSKLSESIKSINTNYDKFRISEVLMSVYKLVWDDFCSSYLEMIKPAYQKPIDNATLEVTLAYFEDILKLLHPFMPFISEEIWSLISERSSEERLIVARWPKVTAIDSKILFDEKFAAEVISGIRTIRKEKNIPNKDQIELFVKRNENTDQSFDSVITKLGNLSVLNYVDNKVEGALSFRVKSNEYYIPLAGAVNIEEQIATLTQELEYTKGFLNSVMKKLSNERFVKNAPEQVIANERKKQSDAEAKIKTIEEQLSAIQ
ncbi:MAG: valine--tRNA ligase [Bacteroidetes bacterium MED-G21]|nr:MAG: valine--tRNA ligase [Bacteroidetes bacterium MED-G21]